MLYNDYFFDFATHADNFWRRYLMSKELFMEIFHGLREFDPYFKLKHDAVGTAGFSSFQKCTTAMRMLAYGAHVDAQDDYVRMSSPLPLGAYTSSTELWWDTLASTI
jgi:hypothetical protein